MPASLSPQQNEYARALLRQLLERYGKQTALADALEIDQSAIAAIVRHDAVRGTSANVLIRAALLAGRPVAEVASVMKLPLPPPAVTTLDAFRVGAEAAVLDGASQLDVDAVAATPAASDPSLTWQRAYTLVSDARTRRVLAATAPRAKLSLVDPPSRERSLPVTTATELQNRRDSREGIADLEATVEDVLRDIHAPAAPGPKKTRPKPKKTR